MDDDGKIGCSQSTGQRRSLTRGPSCLMLWPLATRRPSPPVAAAQSPAPGNPPPPSSSPSSCSSPPPCTQTRRRAATEPSRALPLNHAEAESLRTSDGPAIPRVGHPQRVRRATLCDQRRAATEPRRALPLNHAEAESLRTSDDPPIPHVGHPQRVRTAALCDLPACSCVCVLRSLRIGCK
jgi:hypothetical protein